MVESLVDKNLVIRDNSQSFLLRALLTLPVNPIYSEISMVADGLAEPSSLLGEQGLRNYISECEKRGIAPFTKCKTEYGFNRLLIPSNSFHYPYFSIHENMPEFQREAIWRGLRQNRRTAQFEFKETKDCFGLFRKKDLPLMIEGGYNIYRAELSLTYESSLSLKGYHRDGFKLNLDENDVETEIGNKLSSWYNDLKEPTEYLF